ncbi:DUF317 domain-containing protein [Streptomyces sp. NPDC087297]|uniref:DUF317 domain-containing protein n=1 Tax=Streptomyces sp. NPDC087297 TaxID=3365778 RepID=UPI0038292A6A
MTTYAPALLADDGEPSTAIDILITAGWTSHSDPKANLLVVSPDGRARLLFQPESVEYANTDVLWRLEAVGFEVPPGYEVPAISAKPSRWTATFTGEVPIALIAALLGRLVAPEAGDGPVNPEHSAPTSTDA